MRISKVLSALAAAAFLALALAPAASAGETKYAEVRGWAIIAITDNNGFNRCAMETRSQSGVLRLATNGRGWSLSVPSRRPAGPFQGLFAVDGQGNMVPFMAHQGGRASTSIAAGNGVDALRNARLVEVSLAGDGSDLASWAMAGADAAVPKVKECAERKGNANAGRLANNGVEDDAARLGAGCPAAGQIRSLRSDQKAKATFTNRLDHAVTIYWLDFKGKVTEYAGLLPGESWSVDTFVTHPWIAKDFDGTCFGGVYMPRPGNNTFVVR